MKLLEGVDYVLEEGKMVLTREFLLKRGYCCNSKCRNCPYNNSDSQIKIESNTYELINNPYKGVT